MNTELQNKLNEIISEYGKVIVKKKKTFESYMNDLLHNYPAERNISIHLGQLDILSEIASPDTKQLGDLEINRYAKKLADIYGFNFEKCKEMIVMWANALGVKTTISNVQKSQSQTNNSYTSNTQSTSQTAMFGANPQHTGVYHTKGVDVLHGVKWKFKTRGWVNSCPVVSDGVVYVGSQNDYLYALDANTGEMKWKFKIGRVGNPVASNGAVYIITAMHSKIDSNTYLGKDHYLYAIDANTGKMKWKFKTGFLLSTSCLTVANGIAYVRSYDDYLYAIDANTGKMKWRFETGNMKDSSPAVANGVLYIGSWDDYLYAIDSNTGEMKWKFKIGGSTTFSRPSSPTVANGVVYFGSYDYYLYAIDANTGKMKWRFETRDYIVSSRAVANGVVYFGSYDNYLYAIDANTGEMQWKFKTRDYIVSSPAVANGVVYFGSCDGYLYAIDANTGKLKWKFKSGTWFRKGIMYSSPVVANGVIFFNSSDGSKNIYLYALH